MKTTILEVLPGAAGVLVRFRAAAGVGWALWASDDEPDVGQECSIELDVDAPLTDDTSAATANAGPSIRFAAGATTLTGVLEAVDPDGMGYLRLDADCLVMIETSVSWADPGTPLAISLAPELLRMTPLGV